MSKNGKRKGAQKQNGNTEGGTNPVPKVGDVNLNGAVMDQNGDNLEKDKTDPAKDVSASESFLRMEDHRRQTETWLKRFKNSHFFVRIAKSGEPLWSKKNFSRTASESSEMDSQQSITNETENTANNISTQNAIIDRGNFDVNVSGGVARDAIKCCSLFNGDIVVLLKVNVGVDFLRDPVIEILQFEKYQDKNASSENQDNLVYANQDPCRKLLKWLLPLDNTLPAPHISSSPLGGSASEIGSTSQRRGEEHSSILKSVPFIWKDVKTFGKNLNHLICNPFPELTIEKRVFQLLTTMQLWYHVVATTQNQDCFSSSQLVGDHVSLGII